MNSLNFEPQCKMPSVDFALLLSANSAARDWRFKQHFYLLKNVLLERYGDVYGYDVQAIEHKCYRCHGNGCMYCVGGIYDKKVYYLQRYIVNEHCFHRPVVQPFLTGPQIGIIKGYVQHEQPKYDVTLSYLLLLYKYSNAQFLSLLDYMSKRWDRQQWQRWGECSKASAGAAHPIVDTVIRFYGLEVDDLPF